MPKNYMKVIKFYRTDDEYGYLSNFAPYVIFLDCFMWRTVEHYFQANKFNDFRIQDRIREIESPMEVAKEGRNRKNPLREDWEQVKDKVMKKALRAKFLQHHQLKKNLLNTDDAILVEHTSNDTYWADGGDGSGKNRLGQLLMEVREEIRQICDDPNTYLPTWIAFPDIGRTDMFWRMGFGEEYVVSLSKFYANLPDKKAYDLKFPEPEEW